MNALFLLDPNFGYPFARINVGADTAAIRTAVAAVCADHFDKPVRHVSALYLENFSTLKILFRDGSDVFVDVDYDEPEIESSEPF